MVTTAAFIGTLIGIGADFLTWIPAAIAVFAFTKQPWWVRLAGALAVNFILCIAIATARGANAPAYLFAFELLATAVWFGIFMGIRALISRRSAA